MTLVIAVANVAMAAVAVVVSIAFGLADGDARAAVIGVLSALVWALFAARPARLECWAQTRQRRCAVVLAVWALVVIVVGPTKANPGYLLIVMLVATCGVVVPNRAAFSYGVVVGLVFVAWTLSSGWAAVEHAGDTFRIPITGAAMIVAAAVGAMLGQARERLRVLALELELGLAQERQRNAALGHTKETEDRLVAFLETSEVALRQSDATAANVVREVIDTRNGLVGEIVEAANRLRRPPRGLRDAIQRLADNRRALSRYQMRTVVEIASEVPDDVDPLIQALVLQVVINASLNVIRWAPDAQTLLLRVERDERSALRVIVEDDGSGVIARRVGGGLDKTEGRIRAWTAGRLETEGKRVTAIIPLHPLERSTTPRGRAPEVDERSEAPAGAAEIRRAIAAAWVLAAADTLTLAFFDPFIASSARLRAVIVAVAATTVSAIAAVLVRSGRISRARADDGRAAAAVIGSLIAPSVRPIFGLWACVAVVAVGWTRGWRPAILLLPFMCAALAYGPLTVSGPPAAHGRPDITVLVPLLPLLFGALALLLWWPYVRIGRLQEELGSLEERTARGWTAYALSRDVHHRGSRLLPVLETILDEQQLTELGDLNDALNRSVRDMEAAFGTRAPAIQRRLAALDGYLRRRLSPIQVRLDQIRLPERIATPHDLDQLVRREDAAASLRELIATDAEGVRQAYGVDVWGRARLLRIIVTLSRPVGAEENGTREVRRPTEARLIVTVRGEPRGAQARTRSGERRDALLLRLNGVEIDGVPAGIARRYELSMECLA